MEVGLGPGHIVLDGDPAENSGLCPFRPYLLWPNGWIDQDATSYGGRPWPRPHCAGNSAPTPKKRHSPSTNFGLCLLWSNGRMDQDATCYKGIGLRDVTLCYMGIHHPAPPPKKGDTAPIFGPCLLWPNGRPYC